MIRNENLDPLRGGKGPTDGASRPRDDRGMSEGEIMKDSTGGLPELTPEQRASALVKAAEARSERAKIKMDIRSGVLDPANLAIDPEGAAGRMRVFEFLTSCPGIGAVSARKVIREIGVSETKRLRGLGSRQRALLSRILTEIAAGTRPGAAIAAAHDGKEAGRE